MPMTLRLSDATEARLDAIAADTGLSKNAVVEQAICAYDANATHRARFWAAIRRVDARDTELLDRLSR